MTTNAAAVLTVCLAASIPYLSTIHNYFVADDFGVVWLLSQKPASYFPRWFVTSWMDEIWGFTPDEIRPFPALSYQVMALWGPASPVAYHVMNIAIHALNALLVLAIARAIAGLILIAATFAGIVFAILPIHAESVAWITGRVDTIPAFFYMASFLAYARWRRGGANSKMLYVASVGLFLVALFSKQNTITMIATLLFYDVLIERRPFRPFWPRLAAYVPFVVLTAGYLWLRYLLFGAAVREGLLSAQGLEFFKDLSERHLQRMMFGDVIAAQLLGFVAALLVVALVWILRGAFAGARSPESGARASQAPYLVLYFGPVWWLVGIAPIIVAGYESSRHMYLASLGWAILLGLAFQALWQARHHVWRYAAVVAGAGLIVTYAVKLQEEVTKWNAAASVSEKIVADVEREALAAPEGSLLIVGAPPRSWEWALPFALQPPFTRTDLAKRVFIVSPMLLHCCRAQWSGSTRRALRAWAEQKSQTPVVMLRWDSETGRTSRLSDREDQPLRSQVLVLLETDTPEALNRAMLTILRQTP